MLLFLIVTLTSSAQIQRSFFNVELGKSTKQEVTKALEAKGYTMKSLANGSIMIANVDFGGRAWSGVGFTFYKGKLSEVKFIKMPKPQNLRYYYDNLLENLNHKYSQYFVAEVSSTNDKFFMDGNTAMSAVYSNNPESIILLYQDNAQIKDYIQQDSGDL